MKRCLLLLTLLVFIKTNLFTQIININPDTTDIPWITGDVIFLSAAEDSLIERMELTPESDTTELPFFVDNAQQIYMPPVFHQEYSYGCVQVSEVWYTFTYEINRVRNLSAGNEYGDEFIGNQYHPWFTYNYMHDGRGEKATGVTSGFDLIEEMGCPSFEIYNDTALDDTTYQYQYWMHGYEKYLNSMKNRIVGQESIWWNDTLNSLSLLKHWLADHNSDDSTGGLATMAVYLDTNIVYNEFPVGSPEEDLHFISAWGLMEGRHMFTIVGYHDSVQCFDLDTSGVYENIDRNGDSIISVCL